MKLESIDPFQLKPNPWNSNKMDRPNFEKLKLSVQNLSMFKPIVVRQLEDDTLEILGGAHRAEAAKELKFPTVPVFNIGKIDDERAKEISLIDNTRYGEDDSELLSKILDEIDTTLLESIMPDIPVVLPDVEDVSLDDLRKEAKDEDEEFKTLHYRYPIDKAEEVEAVLARVAVDKGFKFPDGYTNYAEALFYIVTKYKED